MNFLNTHAHTRNKDYNRGCRQSLIMYVKLKELDGKLNLHAGELYRAMES